MNIFVVGDFKAYTQKYVEYFRTHSKPEKIFGDLLSYTSTADYSIYNQEFPITLSNIINPIKKGGLCIRNQPVVAKALKRGGFNLATFATNHTLDYGLIGVRDTIKHLGINNISVVGAGISRQAALKPLILEKFGLSVAVLNYCENQYNVATLNHGGASALDIIDNVDQIKKIKRFVDHVIVIIHGGTDYCAYPSPRTLKHYRFYAEAGASAIISHHAHVVAGYEVYKKVPIFYGIGNLIPGKIVIPECKEGIGLALHFKKASISWKVIPFSFSEDSMEARILSNKEEASFMNRLESLSSVIQDEKLLKKHYGDFLNNTWRKMDYLITFRRQTRLWYRLLKKLKCINFYTMIKSNKLQKNRRDTALLNLIRCESHRDAMNHYFEQDIDNY